MFAKNLARLLLLLAAGVGSAAAQEKVRIYSANPTLDVSLANTTSIPTKLGYWRAQGLDVQVIPGTAAGAIQALATGNAEFASGGLAPGLIAIKRGVALQAVYLNLRKNVFYWAVPEASPIRTIADLKGRTLGVFSYGGNSTPLFKEMLNRAGVNPERDITLVEIGVGAQALASLKANRVAAWGTWDAQIAALESFNYPLRRLDSPFADALSFGAGYFVRKDFLEKHRDTVVKVLRGIAEGTVFAIANPEAAVKIHFDVYPNTKPVGQDEQAALQFGVHMWGAQVPALEKKPDEKWGQISEKAVAATIDFLVSSGDLSGPIPPAQAYTNDVIADLNKFDEPAIIQQAKAYH